MPWGLSLSISATFVLVSRKSFRLSKLAIDQGMAVARLRSMNLCKKRVRPPGVPRGADCWLWRREMGSDFEVIYLHNASAEDVQD